MMPPRTSLFAEHEREERRTKIGGPLVGYKRAQKEVDARRTKKHDKSYFSVLCAEAELEYVARDLRTTSLRQKSVIRGRLKPPASWAAAE